MINLEGGHIVPANYGLKFAESKYFEVFIEPYILKIDHLFHKPIKGSK